MNNSITAFAPGNQALEFIEYRIADDNYRGSWSSQHNRYTIDDLCTILSLLDKYAPNYSLMRIRDKDIAKRQQNTPEEKIYAQFCNEAYKKTGIGTQDAMRKNLFVDFHRMGFINRYDKNKNIIEPLQRGNIKYVSITTQGKKIITTTNQQNRLFIFSKGLDFLLGGYINILLELFRYQKNDINKISIYEFMFFVSAVNTITCFNINIDKCVELIKSYRSLYRSYFKIPLDE
ncbi:MAG: hypothetical protein LBC74_16305 [Planctomycetaceae bacterium]|jgi:type II restriction enzyme|nr:hypothetical protein [Planctomycetaceae bacterium]